MKTALTLLLPLPLLVGAVLLGSRPAAADRSGDVELLVITSASNRGEVDPCG